MSLSDMCHYCSPFCIDSIHLNGVDTAKRTIEISCGLVKINPLQEQKTQQQPLCN